MFSNRLIGCVGRDPFAGIGRTGSAVEVRSGPGAELVGGARAFPGVGVGDWVEEVASLDCVPRRSVFSKLGIEKGVGGKREAEGGQ